LKKTRVNNEIIAPEVLLIDAEGEKIGTVKIAEAMATAKQVDLDLVEISPNAIPPVCRIMDYGKYRFEHSKKLGEQKKKQKQVQLKEVKFRPSTDVGDYNVKLRKAIRFLENGDKVKFTVRFRGREMSYQQQGFDLLAKIEQDLGDTISVDLRPKFEGRQMTMVVSPKKSN